jgi:hypothetical protein
MYSNNLCINTVLFIEESKLLLGTGLEKDDKNEENNNNDNSKSKYFGFVKKIGNIFKKIKKKQLIHVEESFIYII